jgi:energy-coupling factor transport system ATP-binding protein
MNNLIEISNVSFEYRQHQQDPLLAVDNVTLSIPDGSHTAILGRNGSGKSTLARLVNALEKPDQGMVIVQGMNTDNDEAIWQIRRICGMVFQNPDNQIVGTTVEEDVAFGPENLGVPPDEIRRSIDQALAVVGLENETTRPPHLLSGGQKQKLAIAGILAMHPRCLILDESTAMLDPVSRHEFMQLVQQLIRDEGITVINITHHMEEVLLADHVYVMDEGRIALQGSPAEIFEQVELIKKMGLDVPTHIDIVWQMSQITGIGLQPLQSFTWGGAVSEATRILTALTVDQINTSGIKNTLNQDAGCGTYVESGEKVISVENLSYTYNSGTSFAKAALVDVSFDVYRGELFGIIGHSGSGKSTLIQHFNGLIRPQTGSVRVLDLSADQNSSIRKIRQKAGLLFQYPEHQLFEETVYRDIAFGPKRMGMDANEIDKSVLAAAEIVGIDQAVLERSPFELSGGQKRRVAIAGILAMKPEILILDEPAAGLDPAGRDEILGYAARLRDMGVTVILVSHSMEDIARLADRVLVMQNGRIQACGTPMQVFQDEDALAKAGLSMPRTVAFLREMAKYLPNICTDYYTPAAAAQELVRCQIQGKGA